MNAPAFDARKEGEPRTPLRLAIDDACRRDEPSCIRRLRSAMREADKGLDRAAIEADTDDLARRLVQAVRRQDVGRVGMDTLMRAFSLTSEEGVALLCVAEALLRIPDTATADRLIADKLGKMRWQRASGSARIPFMNAARLGLGIAGRLAGRNTGQTAGMVAGPVVRGMAALVRTSAVLAMRLLAGRFVAGRSIETALADARRREASGYLHSYDMLGEAAMTAEDALRYFAAYERALDAVGHAARGRGVIDGPGISVKLSALHPRYARAQRARVMVELLPRLKSLAVLAKHHDIGINIDAEETERLDLSLDLFEALAFDPDLAGFDGMGFVVQAYQKRCPHVIDWLADLAVRSGRRFMVRLVKGAYWDREIKKAQVDGASDYPVFTRKLHTDMSYLLCARKLLAHADRLYPQFATHNAQTLAAVYVRATHAGVTRYEFQCLHGMGRSLYDQVVGPAPAVGPGLRCRVYAPVGPHCTLLPYLVRRLLENGANATFVNRVTNAQVSLDELVADPFVASLSMRGTQDPRIVRPDALYGPGRVNSRGVDFDDEAVLRFLSASCAGFARHRWDARPLAGARDDALAAPAGAPARAIRNPADRRDIVGYVVEAGADAIATALATAHAAVSGWQGTGPVARAAILRRAADLLEQHRVELMMLGVREAGKTLVDAAGEIREGVDFLRYYAGQAESMRSAAPLGVVACISPWNFPLAIFLGQVGAALAVGNAVLAKPAEQTPLVAARAVALLHLAGVPRAVLQFLPGGGAAVGALLVADRRVRGVLFTGSTLVARSINRVLAARALRDDRRAGKDFDGIGAADADVECALIAETGGVNAMIVDSSALPEQVVRDVLTSAFDSAGQRCSALRVLCLQEEIADSVLAMLRGALAERCIGRPDCLAVDIGPVIDAAAQSRLQSHVAAMRAAGLRVWEMPVSDATRKALRHGSFVLPTIIELDALSRLKQEVFGPVLHVLRYRRSHTDNGTDQQGLGDLIAAIDATGFGLTLGIHSRIEAAIGFIVARTRIGNIYVNRTMIGAVVGTQPFGGEGQSGTGPKAGGPSYLRRLVRDGAEDGEGSCFRRCPGEEIMLPGPTGERNTLHHAPRGLVLCVAATPGSLLQQLEAVIATGNRALVADADAVLLPPCVPAAVVARIDWLPAGRLDEADLRAALVDATLAGFWRERLAERDGPLVQMIVTRTTTPVELARLVTERTLTFDTTAAGGNASLLTLGI